MGNLRIDEVSGRLWDSQVTITGSEPVWEKPGFNPFSRKIPTENSWEEMESPAGLTERSFGFLDWSLSRNFCCRIPGTSGSTRATGHPLPDRLLWCLGGTALRNPGSASGPTPKSDGRPHPLCIDRSSDVRMDCRTALLVGSTLRGNCDRGHASDKDHTPARRSDSPDRRDR